MSVISPKYIQNWTIFLHPPQLPPWAKLPSSLIQIVTIASSFSSFSFCPPPAPICSPCNNHNDPVKSYIETYFLCSETFHGFHSQSPYCDLPALLDHSPLGPYFLLLSPLFTVFQTHWIPCFSLNVPSTQVIPCILSTQNVALDIHLSHSFTSFRSFFKCYFGETFPDHPI